MNLQRKLELDDESMEKDIKVKFQGREYNYIGGALATDEQWENFEESYAHCFNDGRILRHQEQIGTVEELEEVK